MDKDPIGFGIEIAHVEHPDFRGPQPAL